jgi:hypothetical protein
LALKLDAMRVVPRHRLPSFEGPARRSILISPTVRPKGPTPSSIVTGITDKARETL